MESCNDVLQMCGNPEFLELMEVEGQRGERPLEFLKKLQMAEMLEGTLHSRLMIPQWCNPL